jgi:nicotinate-nucleotide adenylyltransferase
LAGNAWCEVDDQEIKRGGISYTIDTVRDYARRFAGAELFYLIGADHVEQLPKWRESGELARLVKFAVIPRPGRTEASLVEPFSGHTLRGHSLALSSSDIRARVKAGLPLEPLVPTAVAEAIRNNGLYL